MVRGHLAHALAWEVELLRIGPAYEIGVPGALSHCGVEVGEHDHLRVGLRVRQHLVQVVEVGVDVLGRCLGIGPMGHDDGKGDPGGSIPGMPMGNQEGGGKLMDLQVEAPRDPLGNPKLVAEVAADSGGGGDLVVLGVEPLRGRKPPLLDPHDVVGLLGEDGVELVHPPRDVRPSPCSPLISRRRREDVRGGDLDAEGGG